MSTQNQIQKELEALKLLRTKNELDLNKEKEKFAEIFKGIDKKDLFPEKKKYTLWQRIKKVLNF
jgi:hypothetical protein